MSLGVCNCVELRLDLLLVLSLPLPLTVLIKFERKNELLTGSALKACLMLVVVGDVVPVTRLEGFRALKLSKLEYFRAFMCNCQIRGFYGPNILQKGEF